MEGPGWTRPRDGGAKEQAISGAGSKVSTRPPSKDTHLGDFRTAATQASREGHPSPLQCLPSRPQHRVTVDPAACEE